ncbi:MAG: gluconokinase [Opitutaceae bacterium]
MPHKAPLFILLMGVSGVGKTTIGEALAEKLSYTFLDADDFHSQENRDKMASGQPLNDADRLPWLEHIHSHVSEQLKQGSSIILACSALKQSYRETLLQGDLLASSKTVWLDANKETLQQRTQQRSGHFMPASLLESQCKTLETPVDALRIDANRDIDHILQSITASIE